MSTINTDNINTAYPVSGRDNDSEGFRTNFSAIALGLEVAKTEITELQNKALLKSQLVDSPELENNLTGNFIENGVHKQFYPAYNNRGTTLIPPAEDSNNNLIDLNNGPVQKFTLVDGDSSGGDNFIWANWPQDVDVCATVRLLFTADVGVVGTKTVTFSGNIVPELNFPPTLTVQHGTLTVIDAWSIDNGTTIYLNFVGEY